MKLFEELDNDLMNVNSVQSLSKILRANGVIKTTITDSGMEIETNTYGLVNNVPAGQVSVLDKNTYGLLEVGYKENGVKIFATVFPNDKDAFTKATGIHLINVESEGNNEA